LKRRCAHIPCGAELPADVDQRTRYCSDAHRKAAARARKAAGRVAATGSATSPESDGERYEDLRAVWAALVAQIATDGVLVPGSAGAPVAHPGLRFLAQLDAALSAHERATDTADADPLTALRDAARKAVEENRRARTPD
jgi:hypothetical protein